MSRTLAVLLAGTLVLSGLPDSTVAKARYVRLRFVNRPGPHYITVSYPHHYVKGKGWLWKSFRIRLAEPTPDPAKGEP